MNLGDERSRRHLGRNPKDLGLLRRVGEHREVAKNDHVGVWYRGSERLDEALDLPDGVTPGRQRVAVPVSRLAIVRDQQDPRDTVE